MRSFRSALAFRVALQSVGVAAIAVAGATLYLRAHFLSDVDTALLETAQFEAQNGASQTSEAYRFRAAALTAQQSWKQLLNEAGAPGPRSGNLHEPLPVPVRALQAARGGGAEPHSPRTAGSRRPSGA